MISSMTGYGRGEVTEKRIAVVAEVRSVNNRYLEVATRLPRTLALRENDIKDLVRSRFLRGKVNVVVTVTHDNPNEVPVRINISAAKAYYKLLTTLKKSVKLQEKITLDHLMKFPEVLEVDELERGNGEEWLLSQRALILALDEAAIMRRKEGEELMKDLEMRVRGLDRVLDQIEQTAATRMPDVKQRLGERLTELLSDVAVINHERLEFELALFADKLDLTEECVRFRSHNKFFLEAMEKEEGAGRKLNFLVQEMNREANTIGSKANSAEISHMVVGIKDELEKVREQLQNFE